MSAAEEFFRVVLLRVIIGKEGLS